MQLTRTFALIATVVWLGSTPAGAISTVQPTVEISFRTRIPGFPSYPGFDPDTIRGGPQPLRFFDSYSAPPPPYLTSGCSGDAEVVAGFGSPSAATEADSASASVRCPSEQSLTPNFNAAAESIGNLIYKIKGPGAVSSATDVSLVAQLHGTLSATSDFGSVGSQGTDMTQVDFSATAAPSVGGISSLSGEGSLKSEFGFPFILGGDLASDLVNQSSGSTSIFALDHVLQTDFTTFGWLATVKATLDCVTTINEAGITDVPAQSASCDFDLGDTSAYLEAVASGVLLERVPPLRVTAPRSAAYLSPASAPIQTSAGSAQVPSAASGSGALGELEMGGGDANVDLPVQDTQLVIRTGASSHVDQSAGTAGGSATVATEGQAAASLRYHLVRQNGFTGNPKVHVSYSSVDARLAGTKGVDPSILQRSSFELSTSVQGAQFFHFFTLTLGTSNEDPPGLSGDLSQNCVDESTPNIQACRAAILPDEPQTQIIADTHDDIVLTLQTDCSTSVAHPSGALPAANPACAASQTVVAKLVSDDPNVVLQALPEPGADALAVACASALFGLRRRRA